MLKKTEHKRRRVSEIYFVLYLAALIMLLPGKNEKKGDSPLDQIIAVFQQSFSLLPEKNTLLCRMYTDTKGMKIIECDSSNVLLITGNVKDVSLECSVEDQDRHEVIKVDNSIGQTFGLQYDSIKKLVFFYWHPPESLFETTNSSRSYLVTIRAFARPDIGDNSTMNKIIEGVGSVLRTEAKFSISILAEGLGNEEQTKIVQMPAETTYSKVTVVSPLQNIQNPEDQNRKGQSSVQEFSLLPINSKLSNLSFQPWSNKIVITGITNLNDYEKKPSIRIGTISDGTAEISEIKTDALIVKGYAPKNSSMKVIVTAQRKVDNKELSAEFVVTSQEAKKPIYPLYMYPGLTYQFKSGLPFMREVRSLLKNGNSVLLSSPNGSDFDFTPEQSDIGQTLTFERQYNGASYGQLFTINIVPYPVPEIIKESKANGYVLIEIKTMGINNGKLNRSKLLVIDGSNSNCIGPQELFGNIKQDEKKLIRVQQFKFMPKDPSKPMKITVKAIDDFGKSSPNKTIIIDPDN